MALLNVTSGEQAQADLCLQSVKLFHTDVHTQEDGPLCVCGRTQQGCKHLEASKVGLQGSLLPAPVLQTMATSS